MLDRELVDGLADYLACRVGHDTHARLLYNALIVQANAPAKHQGGGEAPDIVSSPEATDIVGRGDPAA